ncbi:DUF7511 domain-containing protein [Halobiforma nitratireducens]|uniref:DUF7511 domain-containing protein n=1 Tax=Halobiforma nitratireducens JCM 10879 TaxID=1227454 RepID=M0MJN1_9EURY|nr:hypothetical protein [Halobiforma nitratireducens]EMA44650.1 hypothetical protein C446_02832 [Halobiforma nitratireducens JCM 10879]
MTDFSSGDDTDRIRSHSRSQSDTPVRSRFCEDRGDNRQDRSGLESIVVRYEDEPDRCTITPRSCGTGDRLTTWLSVNVTAVVELEERR